MSEIQSQLLFQISFEVPRIVDLGETPYGIRRIAEVSGGVFEGPKLRGTVLPAGGDWIIIRPDKIMQLDVRVTLKTDDDEFIYMTYRGVRHGPDEVIERLTRMRMWIRRIIISVLHLFLKLAQKNTLG